MNSPTCWEWLEGYDWTIDNLPGKQKIDSATYYAFVTYNINNNKAPIFLDVHDASVNFLRELEGSGYTLPCESPDFQFDIDVPVFETVKQKGSISIPVQVTLVKGEPVLISISTTTWQENLGIYGQFVQNTVTPTQSTSLLVQTSCSTPPDNYQFYVNGIATSGVSASSTDMVTVTVEQSSDCPSQNNQIKQPIISGSASASLDSAYDLANQGKYQEALPYLDSVLQQEPDNVIALGDKANALINLEKYEDALTYYDKALQQGEDSGVSLEGR